MGLLSRRCGGSSSSILKRLPVNWQSTQHAEELGNPHGDPLLLPGACRIWASNLLHHAQEIVRSWVRQHHEDVLAELVYRFSNASNLRLERALLIAEENRSWVGGRLHLGQRDGRGRCVDDGL
jgi:hypothetical protein